MLSFVACNGNSGTTPSNMSPPPPPLDKINLPPGFRIDYFAPNVPNAREMALSGDGTILYVGSMGAGNVYALPDKNGDYKADTVITIASGLEMPVGVAWKDGALYVSEVSEILRFDNIDTHLTNPPQPVVINNGYPTDTAHGWKFIKFGPDGKLVRAAGDAM